MNLPKKCLIVLLVVPLTIYYISMYSYSSHDTIEDFQIEYFIEAVSISLSVYILLIIEVSRLKLQKSKNYSVDFTLHVYGFNFLLQFQDSHQNNPIIQKVEPCGCFSPVDYKINQTVINSTTCSRVFLNNETSPPFVNVLITMTIYFRPLQSRDNFTKRSLHFLILILKTQIPTKGITLMGLSKI